MKVDVEGRFNIASVDKIVQCGHLNRVKKGLSVVLLRKKLVEVQESFAVLYKDLNGLENFSFTVRAVFLHHFLQSFYLVIFLL